VSAGGWESGRAAALTGDGEAPGGGGIGLSAEEEQVLLAQCGQACVDEYRKALADAGKTVMQWIKENGVAVLLDVIDYTDLKNCFMTGDVEACLWTLVNVASLVVAVGKLPAVSKAIVKVGTGVTKFLEASAAGKRSLDRLRKVIERAKKAPTPSCPVLPAQARLAGQQSLPGKGTFVSGAALHAYSVAAGKTLVRTQSAEPCLPGGRPARHQACGPYLRSVWSRCLRGLSDQVERECGVEDDSGTEGPLDGATW
jgi:hypothetical protein